MTDDISIGDLIDVEGYGMLTLTDMAEFDDLMIGIDDSGKSIVFPRWQIKE